MGAVFPGLSRGKPGVFQQGDTRSNDWGLSINRRSGTGARRGQPPGPALHGGVAERLVDQSGDH